MSEYILELRNINKQYGDHIIFDQFSLNVDKNSFIIIHGPSGCGKSTLLNMIGLLEKKDNGDIIICGQKNIKPYSASAEKLLRDKIGYLFQNFALVDQESVFYNLKLIFLNKKEKDQKQKIQNALHQVGLDGYENKRICQCSGGEQQRIAIARLLLKQCEIILADEPTGSLDDENKHEIFRLLKALQNNGKTIIVVTHDKEMFSYADQIIELTNNKKT